MTEITQADRDMAAHVWRALDADQLDTASLQIFFARHRMEERAKIVAWLRETQEAFQKLMDLRKYPLVSKHHMEHCKHSADAIEAKEHLK